MRELYSVWRASLSRRGRGGANFRRYPLKVGPENTGQRQNSALFGSEDSYPGGNGDTDSADGVRSGGWIVSQGDPTDNALAAIASILDQPETRREPERPVAEERQVVPPPLPTAVETQAPIQPEAPVETEAPIQV